MFLLLQGRTETVLEEERPLHTRPRVVVYVTKIRNKLYYKKVTLSAQCVEVSSLLQILCESPRHPCFIRTTTKIIRL